jgi:S1-C subfamily serine protease
MIRFVFTALLAISVLLLNRPTVAHAEDYLGNLEIVHRDSAEMVNLFRPITESVRESVVQVLCGGRPVSLGTVVAADGFVLTKRSELTSDPIRVRMTDGRMFPARVAAVRRRNDLAMLRVDSEIAFSPVEFFSDVPAIASFVVSPGRTGRPIGIGVVGV